jgi:DNA-binding MarR family transcriptional regulator
MFTWHAVDLFAVLANESRFRILALLARSGSRGLVQSELAEALDTTVNEVRPHLLRLAEAGFAVRRRLRGRTLWYCHGDAVDALIAFMQSRLRPVDRQSRQGRAAAVIGASLRHRLEEAASASLGAHDAAAPRHQQPRRVDKGLPKPGRDSRGGPQPVPASTGPFTDHAGEESNAADVIVTLPEPLPEPRVAARRRLATATARIKSDAA